MIYFFISFQNYLAMSALSRKDAVIPENSPKGFRICIHEMYILASDFSRQMI